eukprot:gene7055-7847_t
MESNGKLSPDYRYSQIPKEMLTSSDSNGNPDNARLLKKGTNIAWCAPSLGDGVFLQVDVGSVSILRMIATQGVGGLPINKYTKTLIMHSSVDGISWYNVTENGSGISDPQIFVANDVSGNDAVIFNKLKTPVSARYFRIFPLDYEVGKCLRLELFGERVINECAFSDWNICDKTHATCSDNFASYKCHCKTGYEDFSGVGDGCLEIDECATKTHNCSQYASCKNKPGSFTCTCNPGYTGDGYYCEGIVLNYDVSPCHKDAICVNHPPVNQKFFTCQCKTGFVGDGFTCTDIDECSTAANNCHFQASCTNTEGSFVCKCNNGWTGTGQACYDVNECATGTHNCHKFAKCRNLVGSFSCDCISPGFKGDGLYCYDVNECSLGKHNCNATERCYNLVGSFRCQCPQEVPLQDLYVDTETVLFGKLASKLSNIDDKNFEKSIDYYAQKIRTIYKLARNVYSYHFKETTESFHMVDVLGNKLAFEMYDHRCTDVAQMSFPNFCHENYTGSYWNTITDRIDIRFTWQASIPFEQWATPPPTTRPPTTAVSVGTESNSLNQTNVTTTTAMPMTVATTAIPIDWKGKSCMRQILKGSRGYIASPFYPRSYPLNTICKYLIQAPEFTNIFINFTDFSLEQDRKCLYDNVRIFDGKTEQSRMLAINCGSGYLPPAVRTTGNFMLVVFKSDSLFVSKGFNATWVALTPRVSTTFLAFNLLSFTTNSALHSKYLSRMFKADRSKHVPISRILACTQFPLCNNTLPEPIEFTFEHTLNDREDKICIRWDINAFGTTWTSDGCIVGLTNKTHTICKCWYYGMVAVMARDKPYYVPPKSRVAYGLSTNCYMSLVLVILILIGTLLYLLFKDSWIPYFRTILTEKDYDSGRIIQMHIVLNVLLTEIFFSAITFNLTASKVTDILFVIYFLTY